MRKCSIIPELVNIVTNVKRIPWLIFGEEVVDNFKTSRSLFTVKFIVTNDFPYDQERRAKRVIGPYFIEENSIYLKRRIGPISLRLTIEGLETRSPLMMVSKASFLLRFPTGWLLPPGLHLSNVITAKLLEENYLPLHASAVAWDDEGYLFLALPDTGKTLTFIEMVKHGFKPISEDMVIYDGKYIYSCPLTNTYGQYSELARYELLSIKDRFGALINKAMTLPILPQYFGYQISVVKYLKLLSSYLHEEIQKVFVLRCKLSKIFILQLANRDMITKIEGDRLAKEIICLNRNEFWWYRDPLVIAYGYNNPEYSTKSLMKKEAQLIPRDVEAFIVEARESAKFPELIRGIIER